MRIGLQTKSIAINLASAALLAATGAALAQAPTFLPSLVTVAGNGHAGYYGDGGLGTNAQLSSALTTGTVDPAGNMYFADGGNNRIRKVTPAGIITTFAGGATSTTVCAAATNTFGDGCPATSAVLAGPVSVRYHQGGIFITDFSNNRIRRVDLTTNIITTVVGGGPSALNNASNGNNLQALAISLSQPQDLVFDTLGNLYWSQGGGTSRVNVINLTTGVAHLFAGTGGAGGTGTNLGTATSTLTQPEQTVLNGPMGLAVDAANNVYIVEYTNHVIRKVTVGATPTISTYAGIGTTAGAPVCAAATDTIGDGCPAASANFGVIEHMSMDGAGNIYVADSTNNRIRFIASGGSAAATSGGTVSTLVGNGGATESADGTFGAGASLVAPYDAQIQPSGDLLIIEHTNGLARLYHYPGSFLSTVVSGSPLPQTINVLTQAATGTFSLPASTTDFLLQGGPPCGPVAGVTGTVCSIQMSFRPTLAGVRTSPLIFTDSNGTAVAGVSGMGIGPVATLLPGLTATAAGTGVSGATGDGGAATSATFTSPSATAVDGQGNIYVADAAANEVRKFAPGGTITRVAGTGVAGSTGDGAAATSATLSSPGGVAVDPTGNVYISDTGNNKIRMVSALTGTISTVAGTGTAGYTGDQSTPAAATLSGPMQLAWSPIGTLFVADTGNSVIRSIALGEQMITTAAGTGNPGFGGDGASASLAQLQTPQGVAVDGSGNIYIADTGNSRIREVSQGYITTLAGETGSTYNGDGPALGATLGPSGVAADLAGNVYVADTVNQRIRLISSGVISTIMGNGTAGATGDGASSATALVNGPLALALDPRGNIYIADTGNHKIRSINTGANTLTFAITNPTYSSVAQTVSLYDSGNAPLTVGSVLVPAGYIEQASTSGTDCTASNSAPLSLAPTASCNLNTVFNPPLLGTYNGTISIGDNSEGQGTASQAISVIGTSAYVFTAKLTLPATTTAGNALSGTVTVTNPETVYTRTVKFTSTDPQATVPANYTFTTANNGSAPVTVTFKTAGPQCLTVTDTTDPTVTSTACTNVVAAAAAKVVAYQGATQTANVSTAFGQHLIAFVTDAFGNYVYGATVNFTVNTNGAATGTFASGITTYSSTSDQTGYATATTLTSGATIGTFTVTAALAGTTSTATYNLTIVVLGSFTITPAATQVGPVEPGSTSSESLAVNVSGGFNAPITFTCTAPTGILCTAGPNPFYVAQQNLYPASVNFTSQGTLRNVSGFSSGWIALVAFSAGGLLLLGRRRTMSTIALAVLAMIMLSAASGCTGTQFSPTTPNGTYTVTVTGTAQTASATASITYTVQN